MDKEIVSEERELEECVNDGGKMGEKLSKLQISDEVEEEHETSGDDDKDNKNKNDTEEEEEAVAITEVAKVPKKQKGRKGKRIRLITNYVRVNVEHREAIHEYRTKFHPTVDNLEIRKSFIQMYGDGVLGPTRMYDGKSLFLPKKLEENPVLIEGKHPKVENTILKAWVIYDKVRPGRELVTFFNILFRRAMTALGTTEHRKTFLNADAKIKLPQHKLEIWPGICFSVEEQETGLLLSMDTSYRVFRTDTVYDYYCALKDSPDGREQFREYILGKVVVTQYNNFTYRVDDIDWERSPFSTFTFNDKEITYADYVKQQYGVSSVEEDQPLLLSRKKVVHGHRITDQIKIVSLIPQLCFVAGMEYNQRQDTKVMKDLRRYTFTSPFQRVKALTGFIKRLNEIPEAQAIFKEWNCSVEDSLLNVEGREISGPTLDFGKGIKLSDAGVDFSKEAYSNVQDPVPLQKVIVICSGKDKPLTQAFLDNYVMHSREIGIKVPMIPKIITLKGCSSQDFQEALEDYANPELIQLVIVVMPFQSYDIYSKIKKYCVGERGIPSQVVMAKTLCKSELYSEIISNLTLQINAKLGGSPWSLLIPKEEQILTVGIDVYHDVKKRNPSVVGMVATLNNTCTRVWTKTQFQRVHQEITDNMKPLFMEILDAYHQVNGMYPQRIVIFRDGGSMSNKELLAEHEVKPILSAIGALCPDLKHFNYVLVSKRIHQKFYCSDTTQHTISNPRAGTVIDSTVSYPKMFDFYLVPQERHLGCTQPTHFMVISDVGNTPPDFMQKFAYSMCYMFFNWPGSIRVPAQIQYAHKVSALVGRNVKMEPSPTLQGLLYYL